MMFVRRLRVVLHAVDRFRQEMQSRAASNPFVRGALGGMQLVPLLLCRYCTRFETDGVLIRVVLARVGVVASGLKVLLLFACLAVARVRQVPPQARISVLRLFQRRLLFLSTFVVRVRQCRCYSSSRRGVRSELRQGIARSCVLL